MEEQQQPHNHEMQSMHISSSQRTVPVRTGSIQAARDDSVTRGRGGQTEQWTTIQGVIGLAGIRGGVVHPYTAIPTSRGQKRVTQIRQCRDTVCRWILQRFGFWKGCRHGDNGGCCFFLFFFLLFSLDLAVFSVF